MTSAPTTAILVTSLFVVLASLPGQGVDAPVTPPPRQLPPKITCAKPEYDFGEVEDKSMVRHAFVLENTGNAVLEIGKVHPGCGCAVTELDTKTIKPGGRARLTVEMTFHGRRGPMHKTIRVESNDPVNPRFPLHMKGTVYAMAHLEPSFTMFHNVRPDRATEKEVRLISRKPGVNITGCETHSPHITAALKRDPDGRCVRVLVSTVPPLPQEPFSDSITMRTDDPELGPVHLLVSVSVAREVTVMPRQIILSRSDATGTKQSIFILPGSVTDFQVLDVKAPVSAAQVSIQKQKNGMVRIDLGQLNAAAGLDGQTVRIHTDLQRMRTIEIPITLGP